MKRKRTTRGFSMVEVLAALGLLGIAVIMSLAMFGASRLTRNRSGYYSVASSLAQRKLEQIRQLKTALITGTGLKEASVIDSATPVSGSTNVYNITTTDSLATAMPGGNGTVTITNGGTDLVRVDIQLKWTGLRGKAESLSAMSYVADKTVWKETTGS